MYLNTAQLWMQILFLFWITLNKEVRVIGKRNYFQYNIKVKILEYYFGYRSDINLNSNQI